MTAVGVRSGFEGVGCGVVLFAEDVGELGRVEDLAAELALDKLDVLLAGDDADLGMFARCRHMGRGAKSLHLRKLLVNQEIRGRARGCKGVGMKLPGSGGTPRGVAQRGVTAYTK
jgi:hypothetical protein